MLSIMVWRALGDSAWLCEPGGANTRQRLDHVLALHRTLEKLRITQVEDIVASYESISIHFNPSDGEVVLEWLKIACLDDSETKTTGGKTIEIQINYHDPASELNTTADQLGMSTDDLIARHSSPEYEVAAIGFSPGFPYLLGLDPSLEIPRKATPHRVPAGAVAIAGKQTGIYPRDSFGGWHVLGKTNAALFDPLANPTTLLLPGDRVKFIPSHSLPENPAKPSSIEPSNDIFVINPGMHTTIQDLGRPRYRSSGVSAGGAVDPISARVTNRLVGNPDNFAILECAGNGPQLRFGKPCTATWIGWEKNSGKPHHFQTGDTLDLRSKMTFSHGIIAIAGGIDAPITLNSRATDVRARFGGLTGHPLKENDTLKIGDKTQKTLSGSAWHVAWPRTSSYLEIRFIRGLQADWFDTESLHHFRNSIYTTSSKSDRTGIRLNGKQLHRNTSREMVSQPVVAGSIQVPPDGIPIVLLAECQTIGGYPQIGHIISADLPSIARALPGTRITFHRVSLEEARLAWRDLQHELALLKTGLSFLA
jgi:KipI family sensor histidine kinase inhibitor